MAVHCGGCLRAFLPQDIDEKDILSRLARATGSHGRQSAKARFQGSASENATPGSVSASQAAIAGERTFEKKSQPLISKEESAAYWNKQREIDQATKQENAYVPQRANPEYNLSAGTADSLKEKFSNPSSFEQPPEDTESSIPLSEPAPAYEPEDVPEPEPEPEPTYEASAPYDDAGYQDAGGYQEEALVSYQEDSGAYQEDSAYQADGGYAAGGTGLQCRAIYGMCLLRRVRDVLFSSSYTSVCVWTWTRLRGRKRGRSQLQ